MSLDILKNILEIYILEHEGNQTYTADVARAWIKHITQEKSTTEWPFILIDNIEADTDNLGEMITKVQEPLNRRNTILLLGLAGVVDMMFKLQNVEIRRINPTVTHVFKNTDLYQSLSFESRLAYRALQAKNGEPNMFTHVSRDCFFDACPQFGYKRYISEGFTFNITKKMTEEIVKEDPRMEVESNNYIFIDQKNTDRAFFIAQDWLQKIIDVQGKYSCWQEKYICINVRAPQNPETYDQKFFTGINKNLFLYIKLIDDVQNYIDKYHKNLSQYSIEHPKISFAGEADKMYIADSVPNRIYEKEVRPSLQYQHGEDEVYFVNNRAIEVCSDESELFTNENISSEDIRLMDILKAISPEDYSAVEDWLSTLSVYIIEPDTHVPFEKVTLFGHFADFDEENTGAISKDIELIGEALHNKLGDKEKDIYAKRFMEAAYLFVYPYTRAY